MRCHKPLHNTSTDHEHTDKTTRLRVHEFQATQENKRIGKQAHTTKTAPLKRLAVSKPAAGHGSAWFRITTTTMPSSQSNTMPDRNTATTSPASPGSAQASVAGHQGETVASMDDRHQQQQAWPWVLADGPSVFVDPSCPEPSPFAADPSMSTPTEEVAGCACRPPPSRARAHGAHAQADPRYAAARFATNAILNGLPSC
mmetsp:Transcript_19866/g.48259  ORF Transcript_19866/g.48259 Transcript_19866/m.48259 type:complete len:200 (+) Transcript_19866:29-628(+)